MGDRVIEVVESQGRIEEDRGVSETQGNVCRLFRSWVFQAAE